MHRRPHRVRDVVVADLSEELGVRGDAAEVVAGFGMRHRLGVVARASSEQRVQVESTVISF